MHVLKIVVSMSLLLVQFQISAQTHLQSTPPLLTQNPTLSQKRIAFSYAGEIWDVAREGGDARRLVTGLGKCDNPFYSPDGSLIAFTGGYDNNQDVYIVSANGGEPKRLTYHPSPDEVLGWSPDGKSILFRSIRSSARDLTQLYTVAITGGMPAILPVPSGFQGSFSPDTKHLAYTPFSQWQPAWKHYKGGQTSLIWIADLSNSKVSPVPRVNSNDSNPLWVGETLYFLSDRSGPSTLFSYDLKTKNVNQLLKNENSFGINSASAGPGGIVFHQFGSLKLFDFATKTANTIPVRMAADLPQLRPHFAKIEADQFLHVSLSPTGRRVLVEARGEILSLPAEKGSVRNLTRSPGVADRDPVSSPDGKWVAYFSDESGEYALHLRQPDGLGTIRKIALADTPSYFYSPHWSPDSKHIVYADKRLNLWLLDVDKGTNIKVDADMFDTPLSNFDTAWSADSRWIAYAKQLPNHLHAIFVYKLADHKSHQITDGRSEAFSARFDKNGKYLYFIASSDAGLTPGWLDMTSYGHTTTGNIYAAVLRKDLPSPMAFESDEETVKIDAKKEVKKEGKEVKDSKEKKDEIAETVTIDFDGIDQRLVVLPLKRANYVGIETGSEGVFYALSGPISLSDADMVEAKGPSAIDVTRFDLKTRKSERILEGIDGAASGYGNSFPLKISDDGLKMLYAKEAKWFVVAADKAPKAGDGAIQMEPLEIWTDPKTEWRQIYREVWRIQRDFFYDPAFHGADLAKLEKTYSPFLDGIGSREQLNALFAEMTGHLAVGHTFVNGGAIPKQTPVTVGLLGADYRVTEGRYQFFRILKGENWNPKLAAPLTQPGVVVHEGEFLLAVNDQNLAGNDDVYRLFQGLAGKQVTLTIGAKSDGSNNRKIVVVPIASEKSLRLHTWMEANRKRVDEATGGRVAYVYIPDTNTEGFANFNRYFFSQLDKQAVILDERFNHGGQIADYIVNQLMPKPQMAVASREGNDFISPAQAIFGPKVMLINQHSGSGGDALPWLFRKNDIGPLIGKRTWGGLVGIDGYPTLTDGGTITAPRWAIYGTKGEWEVENEGIAPDIDVEQDPALMLKGQDPQLEKGIETVLDLLKKNPVPILKRPKFPVYKSTLPK